MRILLPLINLRDLPNGCKIRKVLKIRVRRGGFGEGVNFVVRAVGDHNLQWVLPGPPIRVSGLRPDEAGPSGSAGGLLTRANGLNPRTLLHPALRYALAGVRRML